MDVRCRATILPCYNLFGLFCTSRLDNYGSWCYRSNVGHFGIACSSAYTTKSISDGVQLLSAFGFIGIGTEPFIFL